MSKPRRCAGKKVAFNRTTQEQPVEAVSRRRRDRWPGRLSSLHSCLLLTRVTTHYPRLRSGTAVYLRKEKSVPLL
ncbi:hypothetical protein ACRALDRAFT_2061699 [Sodiomyces alcalophilus JCM 7366]|uniref:uncharacterized protein n=1 Tax=Sodiomyces alcalophilus JCM 7366 TaxID=591952 RepID=UPI0039B643DD